MYYDFQKAYDNVNHAFMEELLDVYGFPIGVQMLIIEMMDMRKISLSYGARREVGEVRVEIASSMATHSLSFSLCI